MIILQIFLNEFGKSAHEIDIKKITTDLIDEFSLWLVETYDMNNNSINTRLRGFRTFIYYFI